MGLVIFKMYNYRKEDVSMERRIEWTVPTSGAFSEVNKILISEGWTIDDFETFLEDMEVEFPIRIGIYDYLRKRFYGISGGKTWMFELGREQNYSTISVTHDGKTSKFLIPTKPPDMMLIS